MSLTCHEEIGRGGRGRHEETAPVEFQLYSNQHDVKRQSDTLTDVTEYSWRRRTSAPTNKQYGDENCTSTKAAEGKKSFDTCI